MLRDDVLAALSTLRPELERQFSVVRAGVFGSTARDDHGPDSDIDVLVQFDPAARTTLWDYAGLKRYLSIVLRRRFRRKVDVIAVEGMHPPVRAAAERDAVYAF